MPRIHTNAVRDEDRGGSETLLCVSRDVRHANSDDQADHAAKGTRDGVPDDRSSSVKPPFALPDDGAAGDDRKTADDKHDDADVRDT